MAEQHGTSAVHCRRCIYCGCTDDRACVIPLEAFDQPKKVREAYDRFVASCETAGVVPKTTITCWWVSTNPPVCSNPVCARQFSAASAPVPHSLESYDMGDGDESRHIAGQGTV